MTHKSTPRRSIVRPLKEALDDAIFVAHCKGGMASDVMRVLRGTANRLWIMTLDQIDLQKSEIASLKRSLARYKRQRKRRS